MLNKILLLERIMTDAFEDHELGTVSTGGRTITNLRATDDIDGFNWQERKKNWQN